MVAVPTVLGIASIRVYAVREAPADGLVVREKLNVYTPLPQPAQVQFVPLKPGVVESGVTTARESILPFVQAVKGVCVSVKTGSVNLYHAGEDVYYYLKDPPPGFLPRFGTITMAGLLGMFLVRKGSRFKRLAVPLGLMSAGASVCYPAQAVAVLKVTGKKVYAAGQWARSAVSSLLTSVPQEPVAKESVTVPNPEEASKPSFTTDDSDSVAQTEATTISGEVTTPVEGEEPSNTRRALEVSPEAGSTESLLNLDPETEASAPAEPAPKASDDPEKLVVESAESAAASDWAAVTPALTPPPPPPPPPEQPAAGDSKGGSDFKPKPSLMDFGQSNPEDADLYSTRS
ncbi:MICOS complex subunit MIC27 isoform X2 [Mastacembelus armatus]|nr:MICOS complex subunit MIC27-like isoform X2 [Mastacembelus armatus]